MNRIIPVLLLCALSVSAFAQNVIVAAKISYGEEGVTYLSVGACNSYAFFSWSEGEATELVFTDGKDTIYRHDPMQTYEKYAEPVTVKSFTNVPYMLEFSITTAAQELDFKNLTALKKTEKVFGVKCSVYSVKDKSGKSYTLCFSKDKKVMKLVKEWKKVKSLPFKQIGESYLFVHPKYGVLLKATDSTKTSFEITICNGLTEDMFSIEGFNEVTK